MITHRPAAERGHADHGWLRAHHSFSFAKYLSREHMGFRKLRVINEDTVQPGTGFGEHSHDNMEIVTYVIDGKLTHRDSMGNLTTLEKGDVQAMTAGSGLTHSEFNGSQSDELHLLQIWITPEEQDTTPCHGEVRFADEQKRNRLQAIASPNGVDGSLKFGADAYIYASELSAGETLAHTLEDDRHSWIQLISGSLEVNGTRLNPGDGAAISDERLIEMYAAENSEFLLFDLE